MIVGIAVVMDSNLVGYLRPYLEHIEDFAFACSNLNLDCSNCYYYSSINCYSF